MTEEGGGMGVTKERRKEWDRRDTGTDRRFKDRRKEEQRRGERRAGGRRKDFCPTCDGELTPVSYCPSCKVRVIKFREVGNR